MTDYTRPLTRWERLAVWADTEIDLLLMSVYDSTWRAIILAPIWVPLAILSNLWGRR